MLRARSASWIRTLAVYGLIAAIALPVAPLVQAAEQKIDLDGNPANGAESTVETKVLSTFPVEIENIITNNVTGQAFDFNWEGAGPGGFRSNITPGPDVGTIWNWSTSVQVYSVQSPIVFTPSRGVAVIGSRPAGVQVVPQDGGAFMVTGKSIFPQQVTLSSASLTASFITFFSPPETHVKCGTVCEGGTCIGFLQNDTDGDITGSREQLDCCNEPEMTICPDGCKSYNTDPDNCGGCGIACSADEVCSDGACVCQAGLTECGGACVDLTTDPLNCGLCGVECPEDQFCAGGDCDCSDGNLNLCSEVCVDLETDPDNCGDCAFDCPEVQICAGGLCDCPIEGDTLCNEACVDLETDPDNCGDCTFACPEAQICGGGLCDCPVSGETLCGEICTDLLSDPANCNACGLACPPVQVCTGGGCICPVSGETLCGDICTDLGSDPANCGTCDSACPAAQVCSDGGCVCPIAGQELCVDTCVDLQSDPTNCGTCGTTCATDQVCSSGGCICPVAGTTLCGDSCVDLQEDPANCGTCGTQCEPDEFCGGGVCTPICAPGLTLCDGVCVDTLRDPEHCGACGNVCTGEDEICIPSCLNPPDCNGVCIECNEDDPEDCVTTGGGGNASLMSFPAPSSAPVLPGVAPATGRALRFAREEVSSLASVPASVVEQPAVEPEPEHVAVGQVGQALPFLDLESLGMSVELASVSPAVAMADPIDEESDGARAPRDRTAPRRDRIGTPRAPEIVAPEAPTAADVPGTSGATASVIEAPVCDVPPIIEEFVPAGGTITQELGTARYGMEVNTIATIEVDGKVTSGPCPLIVPVTDAETSGVILAPVAVFNDDTSMDGLCQNVEQECNFTAVVENVGDTPCDSPVATLNSVADQFNTNDIVINNPTSAFDNIPGYPGDGVPLERVSNLVPFSISLAGTGQLPDVGRVFEMSVTCANLPETVVSMPIVLGIGSTCDPATDLNGETYDHVTGFLSPVNSQLVPVGNPINVSSRRFNVGSTVPLKMRLGCGSHILGPEDLAFNPEIVSLSHETQGEQLIVNHGGANPDDPFFTCGSSRCEVELATDGMPAGVYTVTVEMPDSRQFWAAFELRP